LAGLPKRDAFDNAAWPPGGYSKGDRTSKKCNGKKGQVARPTRFERVTFAFGARIVCFAQAVRFYPNARYDAEIQKEI
jgi:hypothetical protein